MKITDAQLHALILNAHLATDHELSEIQKYATTINSTFAEALTQKNVLTDEQLGRLYAKFASVPFINLSASTIADDVFRIVPNKFAKLHKLMPFG